jgi:hypothetical protein
MMIMIVSMLLFEEHLLWYVSILVSVLLWSDSAGHGVETPELILSEEQ